MSTTSSDPNGNAKDERGVVWACASAAVRQRYERPSEGMNMRALKALALYAALQSTFSDIHPYVDVVMQNDADAANKGTPGRKGAQHCARHVLSYSVGQLVAAVGVTRALGFRVPLHALLAGTAINAATHYVIDRRRPLWAFLRSRPARTLRLVGADKARYAEFAVVQRGPGVIDTAGPGTALMDIDAAVHRVIGVGACLTTTVLALRSPYARLQD